MADPREDHRSARLVGGGNDLWVAQRAAWLDERADPDRQAGFDAVREWVVRIGGAGGAHGAPWAGDRLGLAHRLPGGVHPAGLARTQADQAAITDQDDRVARRAPHEPPGEVKVLRFGSRRGTARRHAPGGGVVADVITACLLY